MSEQQEIKGKHGGRRPGAGRPKSDGMSKTYSFRADKDVSAFIDAHSRKSELIKECIVKEMNARCALSDEERLSQIGEVMPANRVKELHLPFFDIKIVAGFPIPLNNDELSQDIEVLSMICPHPDASYLIRVQGESMIEAGVHDGDILVVDKSERNPSERQIAVCELNGEYTVKRVAKRDGHYWLIPANPDFPEIEVGEGDYFAVWGVVTYIIHKPNM